MTAALTRAISLRLAAGATAILMVWSLGGCTAAADPPARQSPTAQSSTATAPTTPAFASVLERYSEKLHDAGAPAVIIEMKSRLGDWSTAVGVRSLENREPVKLADQVHIGDITMSMVAVSVMKLVEEGKVRLDDPITKYLPEFEDMIHPPGPVTVRSLLGHRSGMPHYWEALLRAGDAGDKAMSHEQRLAAAATVPWKPQGPAGVFSYSNTNYSALALLVEKLRGRDIGEVLHSDIAQPLGLQDTLMTGDQPGPAKMVHGYILSKKGERLETTLSPFHTGSADSGMISTVQDLNTFFAALQQGKVLKSKTLAEMTTPNHEEYGLGLMKRYDPCSNNFYFGHVGVVLGYGTLALISADGSRQLAIAVARPPSPELVGFDDHGAFEMMDVALKALNMAC
jgi:D-alanyl-D-alanine carboxypeptidase